MGVRLFGTALAIVSILGVHRDRARDAADRAARRDRRARCVRAAALAVARSRAGRQSAAVAAAGGAGTIVTTTNQDWNLSLSQRLATGTRLELDFVNSRTRSTAGTAVEPLNYRSNLALSLTQPLLRGFSPDLVVPRIDVLRAEIASERERAQLAVVAADVVQRTETAYWELVQALVGYGVQLRSRQRAEDQLALTHRQIDAGLLPPSDLISSRSPQAASHSPRGALSRGDRMIASPFTLRRITFHQHRLVHAEPVHCLPA